MGDADNNHIMMTAQEIEALMEDALNEMDDGLDSLFSIINLLSERTANLMSEVTAWQKFRRCFTALNTFVIPIILAIGIAYAASETQAIASSSTDIIENALQTVIMVLMFISGSIGFPLYIFSVWEAYFKDFKVDVHSRRVQSTSSEMASNDNGISVEDVSRLCMPVVGNSFSEFGRLVNRRIMDNIRQDLERRVSHEAEVEQSSERTSISSEISETSIENKVTATDQQLLDFNFDNLSDAKGILSRNIRSETFLKEENDFYGVKVIILNATPDLSVEIEKKEEVFAFTENKEEADKNLLLEVAAEHPLNGIRNIAVENVGEGDSNSICLNENSNVVNKDYSQAQVFGL